MLGGGRSAADDIWGVTCFCLAGGMSNDCERAGLVNDDYTPPQIFFT